jgi:hypothetical protein
MQGDFREHFDLRKLDDIQLGQIEFILTSPAYVESFKPYIQGVLDSLNHLWKDRSKERSDQYPDDFLAGGVVFGEGLLKFFELLIHESSMERIHASMNNVTNDMLYDAARRRGDVKPVVGLDQPASPTGKADPEEY